MAEVFAWPEGQVHLWTGSHTASGSPVALVRNVGLALNYMWQSDPAANGTYRQHLVGKRADFNFQVDYLLGSNLPVLFERATGVTGVHIKLTHVQPNLGSAGYVLYSGRLNNANLAGADMGIFTQTFNGFAHLWSGF